ncbi:MAG: NAD(P)H-binding protein [Chloroflexota bacterium]
MQNNDNQPKIILFGATGNLGRTVVKQGLDLGYSLSVYVRNRAKLVDLHGGTLPPGISVIEGDIFDENAVGQSITGHDTLINAAGYAADGDNFTKLCQIILKQAESHLAVPKRAWFLGGVAALEFADSGIMGVDCPGVPEMYQNHKRNYLALKASSLDWSFMCPGPMMVAPDGQPTENLRISVETMPFNVPSWLAWGPRIALSWTLKRHLPELTVSYTDVATLIMSNLAPNGIYSQKRVGMALPIGQRAVKEGWTPGQ